MQIVAQDKQAADMGLEYAKNASLSQKQSTCPTLPHGGQGHSTPLRFPNTIAAPPTQLTANRSEIRAAL